ncbi:MAG: type I-E CRISPR-associated protein Cas6/Cse3/CasE [Terriglobia bacterium]|jgi:CRISPR system Cascade subunit CasE
MFLSCLLIDIGINPDRPRPGRIWLRNLYHVHQRLCMAIPSASRKSDDAEFLKPYKPEDFGDKQVHVERGTDSGFLYRIDPGPDGRAVILVQSAVKPDWDYAFQNAGFLLAAPAEVKVYEPRFAAGQRLRFRLAANPTKKIHTIRKEERQRCTTDELKQQEGRHGRRVPVPSAEELTAWRTQNPNEDARTFICSRLLDWLDEWRVGPDEPPGFCIDKESTTIQAGYIYVNKGREEGGKRLRSVRYDGILEVTDPDKFRNTLLRGIGPGKAFGFGLLSVAPCQTTLTAGDRTKVLEV